MEAKTTGLVLNICCFIRISKDGGEGVVHANVTSKLDERLRGNLAANLNQREMGASVEAFSGASN